MSIRFRAVWSLQVRHTFLPASVASKELGFPVPPTTQSSPDGPRMLAPGGDGHLDPGAQTHQPSVQASAVLEFQS
jgi:hypothetical protein